MSSRFDLCLSRDFGLIWPGPCVMIGMTNPCFRRLSSSLVPAVVLLGGCASSQDPQDSSAPQEITSSGKATATIANLLPVDGCSFPVTIDGADYAPNDASLEVIRDLVPAGRTIRARISYRLTGGTGQVECGFGTTLQVPKISVRVLFVVDDGTETTTATETAADHEVDRS